MVWRTPVRSPSPIGGEDTGEHGLGAGRPDHERRRMTRARVGQRPGARVVHGQHDRGEVAAEVLVDHGAGHLQGLRGLEPGLEVRTQRVAHEGGAGERLPAVAAHVAEDEGGLAVRQGQRVVEVPAGARALGGLVGDRGAQGAHHRRHRREQRRLKEAHVLEQVGALACQAPGAHRGEQVAACE